VTEVCGRTAIVVPSECLFFNGDEAQDQMFAEAEITPVPAHSDVAALVIGRGALVRIADRHSKEC
jgi:hypothetical protein